MSGMTAEDNGLATGHTLRVLLVDDQMMVAEGVRRMLADEPDIEFHYCGEAGEALATAERLLPTTILQDLVMPDIDGMTLLKGYRFNPVTRDIPVIVLSTKEEPVVKRDAFALGATDYIVKLPDKIELVARIRAHSKSYMAQQERDEAFRRLQEMKLQLEKANAELQRLSVLDGLTGIANRRSFDNHLSQEWKRGIRDGRPLSLILSDIDFFKLYNDHYGHQGGDDCLVKVAHALDQVVQRPDDLVARYGGEEFAVILPGTDADQAMEIAERLRVAVQAIDMPHAKSQVCDVVSLSLGVATVMAGAGGDAAGLIERADEALYASKRDGRNRATHRDQID